MQHNVANHATPPNPAAPILTTKRAYAGIADYAQAHGLSADDLKRWQWQQATKAGRPALKFETKTGPRYRFLDGQSPSYIHEMGYERSWYGLDKDIIESIDDETPLVICNGEISTATAQTYLVPAVCITSGEKGRIPQNLLDELTAAIPGAPILIALDCDPAGRRAAAGMMAQLKAAGFKARAIDLALFDGGDLADFCMMHGAAAYERLMECTPLEMPESETPVFTPRVMPAASSSKPANVSPDVEERAEKRRAAWFKKAFDGIIHTLETTARERNKGLYSAACKLFDLVHSYPQYSTESAAYDALYQASSTNGYLAKDGQFAVNSAIKSAQRTARQYVDMGFDPYDNPAPRGQLSAQAEKSNDAPARAQLSALPDAIVMRGLDIWGLPIVSELNYILGAHSRGVLPAIFTLEDVNQARAAEGIDSATPLHVYVDMGNYGVLPKAHNQLKDRMHPIDTTNKEGCNSSFNSKRGRKAAAYVLPSLADIKRAMFQPMARSLMAMHPDKVTSIDESLAPLMRAVMEGLLNWKKPFESVHLGLVRAFLNEADKWHAEAVYEAIQALPITDAGLLADMGLDEDKSKNQAMAAAVSLLIESQVNDKTSALIALKNRLLQRLYKTHLSAIDNPSITPLPENAPRIGEAWLDAFYNARLLPYNGRSLWNYQLNAIIGIDNKRSAKRAAARAGISSTPREDTRPFTVSVQADCTPTFNTVKRAAKDAAKQGESGRAQHIRSYDERGRLIGSADVSQNEPDDFRIGVRFEVIVQLPNLITVSDAAPLADAIESDVMPERAAADANETPAQDAQTDANESESTRRRRITPRRLHDRTWLLARLLAPFCQTENGLWFNPLTGEVHESAEDVLSDAIGHTAREAVSS